MGVFNTIGKWVKFILFCIFMGLIAFSEVVALRKFSGV